MSSTKGDYSDEALECDIKIIDKQLMHLRRSRSFRFDNKHYDTLSTLRDIGWKGITAIMLMKAHRVHNLARQKSAAEEEVKDTFEDLVNFGYYGLILFDKQP